MDSFWESVLKYLGGNQARNGICKGNGVIDGLGIHQRSAAHNKNIYLQLCKVFGLSNFRFRVPTSIKASRHFCLMGNGKKEKKKKIYRCSDDTASRSGRKRAIRFKRREPYLIV